MIAAIVLSVLVVVGLIVVILVKRQPAANIVGARQLARAEGPVPGMELAADAVNRSRSVAAEAERLAHFVTAAVTPPATSAANSAHSASAAKRQLQALHDGIVRLEIGTGAFGRMTADLRAAARTAGESAGAELVAAYVAIDGRLAAIGSDEPGAVGNRDAADGAAAARVAAATSPADPHGTARTSLLAEMARLGLDTEWPGLPGWRRYSDLVAGYDKTLAAVARDFAGEVNAARAGEAARLRAALESALGGQRRGDALAPQARELLLAVRTYADQVRAIAPSPAGTAGGGDGGGAGGLDGLTADLEATSALLDRCADELADGDFTVAVETLTAVRLPLADAWPPSRAYLAAWKQIAGGLDNQADRQAKQTADALADVAADLSSRIDGLAAVIDSATTAWRRRQDETWTALTGAADTVKRDAAAALRDASAKRDAADPVRAAVAVMSVDEVATVNLAGAVRNVIPDPAAVATGGDLDTRLGAANRLFARLKRNDSIVSGLDGILLPLLAMTGSGGATRLAETMAQLAPVPAEFGGSLSQVVTYAHHPLQGVTLDAMAHGTIKHVADSLVPSLGANTSEHGLMGLVSALSTVHSELTGGLLGVLFDDPDTFPLAVATDVAKGLGLSYLDAAKGTPLIEQAQHQAEAALQQVAHGAQLALPEAMHAAIGHIPFVTVAFSATREIRLYRDEKTTLDHAILGVAVDTGGVIAGIGAGELTAHLIAGAHPGAPIQIPLTIAGSIAGRTVAKRLRQHAWRQARHHYEELSASQAGTEARLAAELTETARAAIGRERTLYLARVGYPELVERAQAAELKVLTTRFRDATASYASTALELLNAGGAAGAGARAAAAKPPAAITAIGGVPSAARNCDARSKRGEYASALLTLTAEPIPAPEGWRPGREYRQLCRQTATRVTEITDGHRTRVARWAVDSAATYRTHSAAIDAALTAKMKAIQAECAAARTALEAAAEAEQREADAAGVKRKE
jgi:hypothetical protein